MSLSDPTLGMLRKFQGSNPPFHWGPIVIMERVKLQPRARLVLNVTDFNKILFNFFSGKTIMDMMNILST